MQSGATEGKERDTQQAVGKRQAEVVVERTVVGRHEGDRAAVIERRLALEEMAGVAIDADHDDYAGRPEKRRESAWQRGRPSGAAHRQKPEHRQESGTDEL